MAGNWHKMAATILEHARIIYINLHIGNNIITIQFKSNFPLCTHAVGNKILQSLKYKYTMMCLYNSMII